MKKTFLFSLLILLSLIGFSQSRTFTGKPIYQIYTTRAGVPLGTFNVELFPNIAPNHVNNFDSLVSTSFYDTTAFHRVIPGFMIQGGDPNSRHGDPTTWGYGDTTQPTVNAEFTAAKHIRGRLSAARDADINSANSQFFVCVATCSWLDTHYSVYGQVVSGMDVVDTIVMSPRDLSNDMPYQKIEMFVTYVGSNDSVPPPMVLDVPLNGTTGVAANKTLKWLTSGDAIYYHMDVSTDSTFATTFKSIDLSVLSNTVTGMAASTTYYWRVRSNNGGHWSSWSPTWHFMTTGVGIDDPTADANIAVLSPNPGNGHFHFSNLGRESSIEIYDILGNLIRKVNASSETADIDLTGKSAGNYFYKISTEKRNVQHGKIILQ